jgi:hypothetical protein
MLRKVKIQLRSKMIKQSASSKKNRTLEKLGMMPECFGIAHQHLPVRNNLIHWVLFFFPPPPHWVEIRASTLSHFTSPLFMMGIFKIGSRELFALILLISAS